MSLTPRHSHPERLEWVDIAKGVGIVLVVFGHALRGIEMAGQIDFHGFWGYVDRLIYSFHMPMFFLLSGYLFSSALTRDALPFLKSRVTRLIWPLFLWTWVFFGAKALAGDLPNTSLAEAGGFPFFPLPPRAHFWFLWGLFLVSVITYGISRLAFMMPGLGLWIGILAVDLLCLSHFGLQGGQYLWFPALSYYLGFFLLGLVLRNLPVPAPSGKGLALAFLVFVAGCTIASLTYFESSTRYALGAVLCLSLCYLLRGCNPLGSPGRTLQRLGNASMAIYLTHTIIGAPIRIALMKAGVTQIGWLLAAVTIAGIVAPLLLDNLARRYGVSKYLGW